MKNRKISILFCLGSLIASLLLYSCSEKEKDTATSLATVTTGGNTVFDESMSVRCEGNVTNDGGSVVLEKGICYMVGEGMPSLANNKVSGGDGVGSFSCSFNVEEAGIYSYRAFATNKNGTSYGEVKSFTISSRSNIAKVTFGDETWYDETPQMHWFCTPPTAHTGFYLSLNPKVGGSLGHGSIVTLDPCQEGTINGHIYSTEEWGLGGGQPVFLIESNYYNGVTYELVNGVINEFFYVYISFDYYNGNDWIFWYCKSFKINIIDFDKIRKKATLLLEAVMYNFSSIDGEITLSKINNAESRLLKIEVYNVTITDE